MLRVVSWRSVACVAAWVGLASGSARSADPVEFARDVAPIIEQHCIRCHKPGNEKGDLSLATIEDLTADGYVTPGKPEESHVLDVVTAAAGQRPAMPKEGDPLSAAEVDRLRRWIADGAKWPDSVVVRERSKADAAWWSLQPLAAMEPPAPDAMPAAWQVNPIDRFVFQKLADKGLSPSPQADKRTLIRRVTYDLTGLPPTPEEVEAFVADDAPDAYQRLVDRLLASPHYGEQWGRHWLDVVRFGESRGFERNEIIDNAWPFRDYVIRSLNEDKPFDVLVREHLAGDVIGKDQPGVEVGVTFLVGGPYDDVGNQDAAQAAQIRANTIDEMIRATAEAFLGLTVGCARCHDHKFDPVLQRDYYGLYATFAGVYHGSRAVATAEQRQARDEALRPLNENRDRLTKQLAALDAAIDKLAEQRAAELESLWKRPPIQRTGTEEKFAPVQAKFVRLVVEGAENNPTCTRRLRDRRIRGLDGRRRASQCRLGVRRRPSGGAEPRGQRLCGGLQRGVDDRRQVRRTLAGVRARVDDHAGGARTDRSHSVFQRPQRRCRRAFGRGVCQRVPHRSFLGRSAMDARRRFPRPATRQRGAPPPTADRRRHHGGT